LTVPTTRTNNRFYRCAVCCGRRLDAAAQEADVARGPTQHLDLAATAVAGDGLRHAQLTTLLRADRDRTARLVLRAAVATTRRRNTPVDRRTENAMTPPGIKAPPAEGVRVVAGIAAAGLLVWMLFALFGGTTVTFEPIDDHAATVTVQCDPLITLFGGGQSFYASDGNSRLVNFPTRTKSTVSFSSSTTAWVKSPARPCQ
jgi:hypothetical protein